MHSEEHHPAIVVLICSSLPSDPIYSSMEPEGCVDLRKFEEVADPNGVELDPSFDIPVLAVAHFEYSQLAFHQQVDQMHPVVAAEACRPDHLQNSDQVLMVQHSYPVVVIPQ